MAYDPYPSSRVVVPLRIVRLPPRTVFALIYPHSHLPLVASRHYHPIQGPRTVFSHHPADCLDDAHPYRPTRRHIRRIQTTTCSHRPPVRRACGLLSGLSPPSFHFPPWYNPPEPAPKTTLTFEAARLTTRPLRPLSNFPLVRPLAAAPTHMLRTGPRLHFHQLPSHSSSVVTGMAFPVLCSDQTHLKTTQHTRPPSMTSGANSSSSRCLVRASPLRLTSRTVLAVLKC